MKLEELLKEVEVERIIGSDKCKVSGISFNSKETKAGDLFICIKGFKTDGHNYAEMAVEKGAVVVVAEHEIENVAVTTVIVKDSRLAMAHIAAAYYGYPAKNLKLIGITGTNGKTTSTYLVKSILESFGKKVGLIGTNQNMIEDRIIPSSHTTPDSLELMQLFKDMADNCVEYVVMEVSSHSLALSRIAACYFEVGAFTNITQDHLDFHSTMEEYLAAKAKLFKMCSSGVINHDDKAFDYLCENSDCRILSYGIDSGDLQAENVKLNSDGVEFDLRYKNKTYSASLAIPGKFSVYNALTAIGCTLALGFDIEQIISGLKSAKGVKGRIEVVPIEKDFTVIIDYAHTPDGIYNIISSIRDFAKGRVVTLFGCGGDRDKTKRPIMGKIAGELSDFCVVTSDNPRSEEPMSIIEDILVGVKESGCEYKVIENRFEAIEYILDNAKKDDIILLAGKGHETYQILKDREIGFDEREIVQKLISSSEF